MFPSVHKAITIGLLCIVAFLGHPARKGRTGGALYDIIAIAFVIASCCYIVVNAERLIDQWGDASAVEMVLGISLIVCLIEIVRRTINLVLPLIIVFFFFYTVYSNHFPGFLHSAGFSYPRTIAWMYLSAEGLWGMATGVVCTVVAGFIIFGAFLNTIGASRFFLNLALSILGFTRGGAAKAAVIGSSLFGTISGSIAANIATTGTITIPLMKGTGFSKEHAGAIESCASTGGMFMPPVMGATSFLIAEFLGISYWSVCIAAFIPALTYYLVLFAQVHLEALKAGITGLQREQLPSLRGTLRTGWHFLLPLVILIFFLGVLKYSAETSIMYTLVSLIIVSFFKKESRLTPKRFLSAMEASARGMLSIGPLTAAIMIIIGALSITGAGADLTSGLVEISQQNLLLLLVLAATASFILGMGMTALSCYLLTVVVMAPALIKLGVVPIAAHMFLFYFGTLSFITPPVCIGAYIASGIAGGDPWRTGMRAMRFGAAAYLVPWAFVFNPALLMVGSTMDIVLSIIIVSIGAISVAAALVGTLITPIRIWERILLILAGVSMFTPFWMVRLVAFFLIAIIFTNHFIIRHRRKTVNGT